MRKPIAPALAVLLLGPSLMGLHSHLSATIGSTFVARRAGR